MAKGRGAAFVGGGAVVAVAAYFLLRGGPGLGAGTGVPGNAGSAPQAQPTAQVEVTETAAPADDGILHITVREDKIYYKGEEITLAGLEEALLGAFRNGVKVILEDDHAIKGTYDEVASLLEKLGITAE